jgi:hypothetical protein
LVCGGLLCAALARVREPTSGTLLQETEPVPQKFVTRKGLSPVLRVFVVPI